MTVLTPAFDTVVPAGKEAKVAFEVPAVNIAGVWRELAIQVDANCTNGQTGSVGFPSITKAYQIKAT